MPTPEELARFQMLEPQPQGDNPAAKSLRDLEAAIRAHHPSMVPKAAPGLSWTQLSGMLDGTSQDMVKILLPFLPALARVPVDVYQGFLSHLGNNDWDGITQLMFEHMTVQEREQLEDEVYKNLVAAVQAQYDDIQLFKKVMTQIALSLLTKGLGTIL